MRKRVQTFLLTLSFLIGWSAPAVWAQTFVMNQTTLSAALTATASSMTVTAATAATGSTFGAIVVGQQVFIDQETARVSSVSSTTIGITQRSRPTGHASGAVVYIASAAAFQQADPPLGTCTFASVPDPWINLKSGEIWRCLSATWLNVVDSFAFVGPGNCFYSTTGGTLATPAAVTNVGVYATTSTGMINAGATAPGTPVMQIATTNGGTATNTISCAIPVPSRSSPARGVYVADVTWVYGVQQAALGTQAVVLASGTMNGVLAFAKIVLPTAAAAETATTVAQARWDTGTMVLTPVAASFNTATTTAGAFYSQKIAPATPVAMTTDLTGYYANFTVLHAATTASTLNVAGVLVHYQTVTGL